MMRVLVGECARIGVARMWLCNGMGLQRCGSAMCRACTLAGLHIASARDGGAQL